MLVISLATAKIALHMLKYQISVPLQLPFFKIICDLITRTRKQEQENNNEKVTENSGNFVRLAPTLVPIKERFNALKIITNSTTLIRFS